MAYLVTCDLCEAVLDRSDSGRPNGQGARAAYCADCASIEAQVDAEIRRKATVWALETSEKLEEERKRLRRELTPAKGGDVSGRKGLSTFPLIGAQ